MKTKIAAIILKDGKILAVRKKGTDILIMPGGGPENSESHEETLRRELREEINVALKSLKHFGSFVEQAIFEDGNMTAHIYFAEIAGEPKASSEIVEIKWIGKKEISNGIEMGSVLGKRVIPKLIEEGLVR